MKVRLFNWLSRPRPVQPRSPAWSEVLLPALIPSPAIISIHDIGFGDAKDWFIDAVSEVGRLSKLPNDWDSYGSQPVTDVARKRALGLLIGMGRTPLPMPQVGAVSGGGLQFEWSLGPRALELEILPDGSIEYLRAYEDDRMSEGSIPSQDGGRLKEQVNWLVQHPA